jgi:hypothetical protein
MHILASHYRSEFLATPQLFRIDHARGETGPVPTLLLKASTLLLKYIVQGSALELVIARCADRLMYGVKVFDDIAKPATIWSIVELNTERDALIALSHTGECPIFLFNELALNAAWTTIKVDVPREAFDLIADAMLGPVDHSKMKVQVRALIDNLSKAPGPDSPHFSTSLTPFHEWKETFNHYYTNRGGHSPIHLFNKDEGGQQEQLAVWLTDSLQFSGAVHSPQVPKGKGRRELTDLLLTYQFGTTLIESKTLTIFNRTSLPTRDTLASGVTKHVEKAVAQLRGAARQIQLGMPVFDRSGVELGLNRNQPVHAIVLVPDFDLIEDPGRYGKEFITDFMSGTKGFLHLLDIAELMRVVQAAEMIARRGNSVTQMMAFDYYLVERAKKTLEAGMLSIEVLLSITD